MPTPDLFLLPPSPKPRLAAPGQDPTENEATDPHDVDAMLSVWNCRYNLPKVDSDSERQEWASAKRCVKAVIGSTSARRDGVYIAALLRLDEVVLTNPSLAARCFELLRVHVESIACPVGDYVDSTSAAGMDSADPAAAVDIVFAYLSLPSILALVRKELFDNDLPTRRSRRDANHRAWADPEYYDDNLCILARELGDFPVRQRRELSALLPGLKREEALMLLQRPFGRAWHSVRSAGLVCLFVYFSSLIIHLAGLFPLWSFVASCPLRNVNCGGSLCLDFRGTFLIRTLGPNIPRAFGSFSLIFEALGLPH